MLNMCILFFYRLFIAELLLGIFFFFHIITKMDVDLSIANNVSTSNTSDDCENEKQQRKNTFKLKCFVFYRNDPKNSHAFSLYHEKWLAKYFMVLAIDAIEYLTLYRGEYCHLGICTFAWYVQCLGIFMSTFIEYSQKNWNFAEYLQYSRDISWKLGKITNNSRTFAAIRNRVCVCMNSRIWKKKYS